MGKKKTFSGIVLTVYEYGMKSQKSASANIFQKAAVNQKYKKKLIFSCNGSTNVDLLDIVCMGMKKIRKSHVYT